MNDRLSLHVYASLKPLDLQMLKVNDGSFSVRGLNVISESSALCVAGTGKTTTLVKFAEQRPHLRFLYVAFNKSVAREAQRRFPSNVDCKTVHSLAYSCVGRR